MTNVFYSNQRGLQLPTQAQARVKLIGPGGAVFKTRVLVDTGATYAQFPDTIAAAIGLNSSNTQIFSTQITLSTGSTLTLSRYAGVQLEIEGIACRGDVIFAQSSYVEGILGIETMLAAIKVGFDPKQWLWGR